MADQVSSEQAQATMALADNVAREAAKPGSTEEKTERVETEIREGARKINPRMTDEEASAVAKQLAPLIVASASGPLAEAVIEQMRQLDVVFTPSESEPGAATDAAASAAADATAPETVTPPRKLTFAERFSGRS